MCCYSHILLILLNRSMGLGAPLKSRRERTQTLLYGELQTSSSFSSSCHTEMFWINKQMLITKGSLISKGCLQIQILSTRRKITKNKSTCPKAENVSLVSLDRTNKPINQTKSFAKSHSTQAGVDDALILKCPAQNKCPLWFGYTPEKIKI